ncbi:MAG: right-handed parallel beta-helix repeat-containing protein, partial [Planctomycetes bacterium]|nr:right-handed parallel beta-helix repeat-containing protein [Planctomycetota bacterium]
MNFSAGADVQITGNEIHDNETNYGVYLYSYASGAGSEYVFEGNLVYANGQNTGSAAIRFNYNSGETYFRIFDNEVYDNLGYGVQCYNTGNSSQNHTEIIDNRIINNGNHGIYFSAGSNYAPVVRLNEIHGNIGYDLYNNLSTDIDASKNWWGEETTEEMSSDVYPQNISVIYDEFDNSGKGFVEYANWLTELPVVPAPTLNAVSSPTQGEISGYLPLPTDGLIAYYPFNNNADDESGGGHHGEAYGAVPTQDRTDSPNSAYYLDGQNDYIVTSSLPVRPSGSVPFAVVGWFKTDSFSNGPLWMWGNRVTPNTSSLGDAPVGWRSDGTLAAGFYHSGYTYAENSEDLIDGDWHMIAQVADNN